MKSKIFKLILLILVVISSITIFDYNVYGYVSTGTADEKGSGSPTAGSIISGGQSFIDIGEKGDTTIDNDELKTMSDMIYNILLTTGIIIAFIIGGILGIKFMTGGLEGQVEAKKALVPFVAGCVVIFGAFTIWKIVLTILQMQ